MARNCVHECKVIHLCLLGGSLFITLCASPCGRLWPTLWSLTICLARFSHLAIQTPTQVIREWLGISLFQKDFGSSFTSCTSTWNPPIFVNMIMWRWDPWYSLTGPGCLPGICWELGKPGWIRCCAYSHAGSPLRETHKVTTLWMKVWVAC